MPDAEMRRLRADAREEARKRREAEEGQRALRRLLYAAQMNLAHQAWKAGNVPGALELLEAQRPGPGEEELRAFEWRYLWRLCQDESMFTMPGQVVALFPDGTILAIGSQTDDEPSSPGELKLWDVASREELCTLHGHAGFVNCVQFFPNGNLLATASTDGTTKLWEPGIPRRPGALSTGDRRGTGRRAPGAAWKEVATLPGIGVEISRIAISPDGKTLAAGNQDAAVTLWNLAMRQPTATLEGHDGSIWCVAFSPDGHTLATGSTDTTVRLWRAATFEETDG
jgi:WD40 repeat protein